MDIFFIELNNDLVERKNICLLNAMKKKPIEGVGSFCNFYRLHIVNVMARTGIEILIENK